MGIIDFFASKSKQKPTAADELVAQIEKTARYLETKVKEELSENKKKAKEEHDPKKASIFLLVEEQLLDRMESTINILDKIGGKSLEAALPESKDIGRILAHLESLNYALNEETSIFELLVRRSLREHQMFSREKENPSQQHTTRNEAKIITLLNQLHDVLAKELFPEIKEKREIFVENKVRLKGLIEQIKLLLQTDENELFKIIKEEKIKVIGLIEHWEKFAIVLAEKLHERAAIVKQRGGAALWKSKDDVIPQQLDKMLYQEIAEVETNLKKMKHSFAATVTSSVQKLYVPINAENRPYQFLVIGLKTLYSIAYDIQDKVANGSPQTKSEILKLIELQFDLACKYFTVWAEFLSFQIPEKSVLEKFEHTLLQVEKKIGVRTKETDQNIRELEGVCSRLKKWREDPLYGIGSI